MLSITALSARYKINDSNPLWEETFPGFHYISGFQ